MACKKCSQAGRAERALHYVKGGRWETRFVCEHDEHERGKLDKVWPREESNTHVLSRHKVDPIKKSSRLKPSHQKIKHTYSEEEDRFILTCYSNYTNRVSCRGQHLMAKMLVAYEEKFGWKPTANRIVGRYNRLVKKERRPELVDEVRGVPGLPVLKFMQRGSHDA